MGSAVPMTVLDAGGFVGRLRMKGRQEKQRYKDQNPCREREIRRFRYDVSKNMIAHDCLPKQPDRYNTWEWRVEFAIHDLIYIFVSYF
jgi:hypothetical protein